MHLQEYLRHIEVSSIDELSDKQVLAYYINGNAGLGQKCAVELAIQDYANSSFTKEQIIASLKKAMSLNVNFGLTYISNESAIGPLNTKSKWVLEP